MGSKAASTAEVRILECFWEAGTGEGREGKGMGAKLLFMTARNEQPHHTSLALIGLEGLIIQTFWVFLHRLCPLQSELCFPPRVVPVVCCRCWRVSETMACPLARTNT